MPTYEYECQRCGVAFERFQSMNDEPLKRCPDCRGKVKRLIGGGAGFLFKGSGFYETDYRSSEYQAAAKEETATPADAGKSAEKKKDAAPAKAPAKNKKKQTASATS